MHLSTTGHRVSAPESRILVWESKDRYPAIWRTRERLKSPRRRQCDCQSPPARYYSSRPDRNQSWALLRPEVSRAGTYVLRQLQIFGSGRRHRTRPSCKWAKYRRSREILATEKPMLNPPPIIM